MIAVIVLVILAGQQPVYGQETGRDEDTVAQIAELQRVVENKLAIIEGQLDRLIHPKWEYKLVVPNMMGSSGEPQDGVFDGVDFKSAGNDGWELVSYSVHYGFIFKRRVQ